MSLRLSSGLPRACSGLMYAAVPRMTPASVTGVVRVGTARIERARPVDRPGEAQVEDLDRSAGRILTLDGSVSVNDPGLVRRLETRRDLRRDCERLFQRERPVGDSLVEGLALDELHDEESRAALLLEAVYRRDVLWLSDASSLASRSKRTSRSGSC